MDATTVAPALEPGAGPISQMVAREITSIRVALERVRSACATHALPRAALALARLREQLYRHMRWEEESLFEELERRADLPGLRRVRAHHLGHEALASELERLSQLVARRHAVPGIEIDLDLAVHALSRSIEAHAARELDEICCPLDKTLEHPMVETIRIELMERGRVQGS